MITKQCGGPPERMGGTSSRIIASQLEEARHSRAFVAEWYKEHGFRESAADDACTVASELVSNVVTHTRNGGVVRLYLSTAGPVIEVWDHSPEPPVVRPLDLTSNSGRGMAIVSALAESWGTNPLASGGKCVWALLRG
ncbi:ATP-binding protein [Spirillospora sp. NPDC050679]